MDDPVDAFEQELGRQFQRYVAAGHVSVPTSTVVGDITSQQAAPRRAAGIRSMPIVAAFVVGALVVIGLAFNGSGSGPGYAWVSGVKYTQAGAPSLRATASDLTPYGQIDRSNDGSAVAGQVAYALRGVDPHSALVVPVKPGMEDVVEPGSDFILLLGTGSAYPALCPYFILGGPGYPGECQ